MENVLLVDTYDNVIGEMEKMEAHKKAKLHRAVSVFIFNSDKQLLLQRRALSKYHSAGLWTNTACTHPCANENNRDVAITRLKEEMRLDVDELKEAFYFLYNEKLDNHLTEHEFDHVFIGFSDALPYPNPDEVCDFKYVDIDSILEQVNESPEDYTVWFREIIEQVLNYINNRS
jgi:isopentenyl-diphosphate delta-isomerase